MTRAGRRKETILGDCKGDPPTRSDARQVVCPYCGAGVDARCVGAKGQERESNHQERVNRAAKVLDGVRCIHDLPWRLCVYCKPTRKVIEVGA